MVDQVELHDRLPRLAHPVSLRRDDHAVRGERVAPRWWAAAVFSMSTMHRRHWPAIESPGVIAVVRHLDAGMAGRLDEVGPGRNLDLLAVDGEPGHGYLGTSASNSPRNFSM